MRVMTENGEQLAFRFYHPRVLRIYLPTCTADELARFQGQLSSVIVETDGGAE